MRTPAAHMQILATADVSGAVWDEVWQLTSRFYETQRSYVEAKLRAHEKLALFRSAGDGGLIGMAAIQADAVDFRGQRLLLIFTSHAIVDERYRGQNLMQRAGARTYLRSCLRHPLRRKFWVFDTFSYRSYLLLPRNLHEFWPRRDRATPDWHAGLMEHYGAMKYGEDWHQGVVHRSAHKRLLPQTATLAPEMLRNPDLAFFSRMNPGHAEGDMLLCLCPLTFANWWGIVSQAIRRRWRRS
jgi:hypothetical protein